MSPFGWQNPATLWRLQRYVQAALSPEIAQEIHANKRIASEPKTKKMNKRSKLTATPWFLLHPGLHASWFYASSSYKVIRWTCLKWFVFVFFFCIIIYWMSELIFFLDLRIRYEILATIYRIFWSPILLLWYFKVNPQLHWLFGLEWLTNFEHLIESLLNTSFWCPFLDPHLTAHYSNIGVWLR